MTPRNKTILIFVILIVVILGLYFFTGWFSRTVGYVSGDGHQGLTECLNSLDSRLYVSTTCPHCATQKEILGDMLDDLNVIVCQDNPDMCQGLLGVPAWEINGEFYYGVHDLDELAEIAGC